MMLLGQEPPNRAVRREMTLFSLLFALSFTAAALDGGPVASPTDQAQAAYDRGEKELAAKLLEPGLQAGEARAHWLKARLIGLDLDASDANVRAAAEHARFPYPPAMHRWGQIEIKAGRQEAGLQWIKKAAQAGFAEAQFDLGGLYESGGGIYILHHGLSPISMDLNKAAAYYEMAARNGDGQAAWNAAKLYTSGGVGMAPQPHKAIEMWKLFSTHGIPDVAAAGLSHARMVLQGRDKTSFPDVIRLRYQIYSVSDKNTPLPAQFGISGGALKDHGDLSAIHQQLQLLLDAMIALPLQIDEGSSVPGVFEDTEDPFALAHILQYEKRSELWIQVAYDAGPISMRIPVTYSDESVSTDAVDFPIYGTHEDADGNVFEFELARAKLYSLKN
jgi:TPR repeat protein